jgi:hypothetical protein
LVLAEARFGGKTLYDLAYWFYSYKERDNLTTNCHVHSNSLAQRFESRFE